jgi:hypothetical protein
LFIPLNGTSEKSGAKNSKAALGRRATPTVYTYDWRFVTGARNCGTNCGHCCDEIGEENIERFFKLRFNSN